MTLKLLQCIVVEQQKQIKQRKKTDQKVKRF